MNTLLVRDLMFDIGRRRNVDLAIGKCSITQAEEIENLPVPDKLKGMLKQYWIGKTLEIGQTIFSIEYLLTCTCIEEFAKDKMLVIGDCLNGDPISIDFSQDECPVLYTDREDYFGIRDPGPREYSAVIFKSLVEFLSKIAEGDVIPRDFHDATKDGGVA